MEATLHGLCARAGLPVTCVPLALQLQRTLQAKQSNIANQGLQSVICVHLALVQKGAPVEMKQMVKLGGAKSRPHYLSVFQNAEKILQLDTVLSVQEISVQLGVSHLAELAGRVLTSYEDHLRSTLGEAKFANLSLGRPIYPCAAVAAACKLRGEKVEQARLADISRAKKKDLNEMCEEMLGLQPKEEKNVKRKLQLMEQIMVGAEEKEHEGEEESQERNVRDRLKEEEVEDDGYEEWKEEILRRAVQEGFTEYKKYLNVKT